MQEWRQKNLGRRPPRQTAACTASPSPPTWPAPASRTCACTNAEGLLHPHRSAGGTRLYSADDVLRLQRITDLLAAGLNLAGIAMVLDLQDDNNRIRTQQRTVKRSRPQPQSRTAK